MSPFGKYTQSLMAALFAIFTVAAIAMVFVVRVAEPTATEDAALTLTTVYGFLVGLSCIWMAFYLHVGPKLNIALTPTATMPLRAPATLFVLGAGIILTSLRVFDITHTEALFWRIAGYALLLSLATGLTVGYVLRFAAVHDHAIERPSDD